MGYADPAQPSAGERVAAALRETVPVRKRDRMVERRRVVARVVDHAETVLERHRLGEYQVPAADLDAVGAGPFGGHVEEPLDDVHDLGPAGAAIGVGRRRVRLHGDGAGRNARRTVEAGRDLDSLDERNPRGRVGADVRDVGCPEGEHVPVVVEREFGVDHEVAGLIVGQHAFGAARGPLDRAPDPARRPQHQDLVDVERVPGAVGTADIADDHADLVVVDPQEFGELALVAVDAARGGDEREASVRAEAPEGRSRFHRDAGDPGQRRLERDDMRRVFEYRRRGFGVVDVGVDGDVRAVIGPEHRGIGPRRPLGIDGRRQRRIVHRHLLGDIPGALGGLGDDHGHGLADQARAIRGQRVVRRDIAVASVAVRERDVGRAREPEIVGNGAEPVGKPVGSGQHGEDVGVFGRRRRRDGADLGMGMRRDDEDGVRLPLGVVVVGVDPAAGEKPQVFLAPGRLADHRGHGQSPWAGRPGTRIVPVARGRRSAGPQDPAGPDPAAAGPVRAGGVMLLGAPICTSRGSGFRSTSRRRRFRRCGRAPPRNT